MIEISHQQARRWIREHMDHRLPDGQWAALQAHLETCRECSTYMSELEGVEKNLQRALRVGMESLPDLPVDLADRVMAARQARAVLQKRATVTGLALAALVAFFLLGGLAGLARLLSPRGNTSPALVNGPFTGQALTPEAPVTGGEAQLTPMPTAGPGDFPDVVLYESRLNGQANGKRQIYLLNPGAAPVDLGDEKANDYSPAWSPDGNWVAFISDRSGKDEVYVTSLTGSQAVQLTEAPGVSWEGPLSWSADGQWLALTGARDSEGGQRWVYLVALDGSGARPLSGSRGGSLPKFAPAGDRLAYTFSDGTRAGISIAHVETGQYASTSWLENPLAPPLAEGSALDWSANGSDLVFIAPQPAQVAATGGVAPSDESIGSQVMAIRDLGSSISLYFDYTNNTRVAESRWPGAFRGASWSPNGSILFLEDLGDARANNEPARPGGCWTLQSQALFVRGQNSPRTLSDLCVEGGLDRGSWTPDGRWLVVSGRMPGEASRSLYAIRMPGRGAGGRNTFDGGRPADQAATPFPTLPAGGNAFPSVTVLRLANVSWLGDLPRVRLRLRSYNPPLDIHPQPIQPASANMQPSNLGQRPGGPTGQVVYVVQNNTTSVVVRANPDGTGGKVLASTPGENRCPRWSPDGKWIALISQQGDLAATPGGGKLEQPLPVMTTMPNAAVQGEAIFIMDENGGSVRQLTRSDRLPGGDGSQDTTYTFDCPAWSPMDAPGGPFIAVTLERAGNWYLAVIRVNADQNDPDAVRYLQIARPGQWTVPTWASDGRSLYLVTHPDAANMVRLMRISLPTDPQSALTSGQMYEDRSIQITGLASAPDHEQVFALAESEDSSGASLSRLLTLYVWAAEENRAVVLGKDNPSHPILSGSLAWLGNNMLGLILRGSQQDPHQARIYLYDINRTQMRLLAPVDDVINEATWSPDGRYVLYNTESGLWGLDIQAALQGRAAPVWLSPQPVQGIDWR